VNEILLTIPTYTVAFSLVMLLRVPPVTVLSTVHVTFLTEVQISPQLGLCQYCSLCKHFSISLLLLVSLLLLRRLDSRQLGSDSFIFWNELTRFRQIPLCGALVVK
jgi:hypothetical protein